MTRAAFRIACVAASVVMWSGCTLLWLFNNDPEGLPCDVSTDPRGACLAGYVCVTVEDDDPDTKDAHLACEKAGIKVKNDPCGKTEECGSGLVCATGYAQCLTDPDNVNCNLINDAEKKLACRTACDVNHPDTCGPDEACLTDAVGDQFCQVGVCATDTDCNTGTHNGFCVGEAVLTGKTGFCFEGCNPLNCSNDQCSDCKGVDGVIDSDTNCIHLVDEFQLTTNAICEPTGTVAPFQPCDSAASSCQAGAFCNPFVDPNAPAVCTPWCNFPNGAPACDDPHQCQSIDGGAVGFCSP